MGLREIAKHLKRNKCEHLIKYQGQEITFTGLEIPSAKVNLSTFSNKIKVLVEVPTIVQALDNNQYLLCKQASDPSCPEKLKNFCLKVRLIQIFAFSQLHAMLCVPKPDKMLSKEIQKWINYTNKSLQISIDVLAKEIANESEISLQTSKMDTEDNLLSFIKKDSDIIADIMKYQNIDDTELDDSISILKQPFADE